HLFEYQIKDIYSAEEQLTDALPKMHEESESKNLQKLFWTHLEETKTHKTRIEQVSGRLNIEPTGQTCKSMLRLGEGVNCFIKKEAINEIKDIGLIDEAKKIENYRIACYEALINYSKSLDLENQAEELELSLKEGQKRYRNLSDLLEEINIKND
ncbi:hypothetical protein APR40_13280, partial [Salegentibacter salarius]